MIALTGAGGFIGSVILGYLNSQGINNVVLFDDLPHGDQFKNLVGKEYSSLHSTDEIFQDPSRIECVIHVGANASTLEKDWSRLYLTNVLSTRKWNRFCLDSNIPFIFTSSAAVYGNGQGPLNHYAFSKLISENEISGVILRLFNVYGPNEYHKGRMASTIYHWHQQLIENFHLEIFEDSDQYLRDFIYVEDVAKVVYHFIKNYQPGIYDIGTGTAVSFESVATKLLNTAPGEIIKIKMPDDLKVQYQKHTCADISTLKETGFDVKELRSVERGIEDYKSYLKNLTYY
jgi:ADP-L-glycero-D-manno-heptose 6-epimerase